MNKKVYASQDYVNDLVTNITDTIPVPSIATVGQIVAVKAVDENGKPTEWETVDPFILTDESTGIKYKLTVVNSTLTMTEVTL